MQKYTFNVLSLCVFTILGIATLHSVDPSFDYDATFSSLYQKTGTAKLSKSTQEDLLKRIKDAVSLSTYEKAVLLQRLEPHTSEGLNIQVHLFLKALSRTSQHGSEQNFLFEHIQQSASLEALP